MAYQTSITKKRKSFFTVIIVFMLTCVSFMFGAKAGAQLIGQEVLDRNMAVVTGKAPNCVIITNHRFKIASNHLIVTALSSIVDLDGKVISLKNLKIPCAVKLSFRNNKKSFDPELVRLEVKEYAKKVSSHFTVKNPFVRHPE